MLHTRLLKLLWVLTAAFFIISFALTLFFREQNRRITNGLDAMQGIYYAQKTEFHDVLDRLRNGEEPTVPHFKIHTDMNDSGLFAQFVYDEEIALPLASFSLEMGLIHIGDPGEVPGVYAIRPIEDNWYAYRWYE